MIGDPTPLSPDEAQDREARARKSRLDLPAVTVREWAELHGVPERTARAWAQEDHLPGAYQSGGVWLVPPRTPHPGPRPEGRAGWRRP